MFYNKTQPLYFSIKIINIKFKNFTGKTMNTVLCKLISREEKRKKILEGQ